VFPASLIFTSIPIDMRKLNLNANTFASSVLLITIFAAATRAIGFFFRIFLSRVLGAEMLGVYQIAMAFFMVLLTLVSSGLPLAISKRVATKQHGGVVPAGLVIGIITSVIACAIVLIFSHFFGFLFTDERVILILIVLLPSVIAASVYAVIRAVWWGERRYFLLGATELAEQIFRIIVFVIMLALAFKFTDMAGLAALSYTVAFVVAAIMCAGIYLKTRKLGTPEGGTTMGQYKPLLKSAAPITGMRLLASLSLPLIAIIIPMRLIQYGWSTTAAVSAFGILVGMTIPILTIPQTIISALSTALVPDLSSAHDRQDTKKIKDRIENAMKFTLFINFLILPAFIAMGPGIGTFLYANVESGIFLSHFAWAMIPMSLAQITNAILNSLGAETRAMKNYAIGAVLMFLIIWFMPGILGIGALVVGMAVCMTVATILNLALIAKLGVSGLVYKVFSEIFIFTLIALPSALLGYFVFSLSEPVFGLFFGLAFGGAFASGSFVTLCHVFNIVKFELNTFKQKSTN